MRELTAAKADDLYELIDGRSLVLTSNRSPVDWYPLFPNPVVAESLLDRLINTSHHVTSTAPATAPTNAPAAPHWPPRSKPGRTPPRAGPWGIT